MIWLVSVFSRCVVPPITVSTPILDYGRCFLHHPYELPVHLLNDSDLPAKYELLSQVLHIEIILLIDDLQWYFFWLLLFISSIIFALQVVEDVTPILYTSPEPKVGLTKYLKDSSSKGPFKSLFLFLGC